MNPSLAEYHIPVHMDVPEIDVMWSDIPDPHSPMRAHGVGEIGITGVGAAVANAVFNACGKRVRNLPIRLNDLIVTAAAFSSKISASSSRLSTWRRVMGLVEAGSGISVVPAVTLSHLRHDKQCHAVAD